MKIPKEHAKILVLCEDSRYLAYKLGKYNIYLEHFELLGTQKNRSAGSPTIVKIRFVNSKDIVDFIKKEEDTIRAWRIFKSAGWTKKPMTIGFLYRSADNFIGLFPGKTLRVKGSNLELRKQFYDICVKVNTKLSKDLQVKFDYDEYDAEVDIRDYITQNGKYWIVIIAKKGFEELPEN